MKITHLMAGAASLALLLATSVQAQTYDPGSVLTGLKVNPIERHQAFIPVQPKAGDYARYDSDLDSLNRAQAYIQAVILVDANGVPITSFGGGGGGGGAGTEFAEDSPHTTGALGTLGLGVRMDTAASTAGTTGDYVPAIYDALGRLWVNGSGVTQPVSGTFWQATQPVSGTFWQATQPVSMAAVPTGGSTAANQTTANTSLNNIDLDLGSSADPAYSGTGGSLASYLRAIANMAIDTTPVVTNLSAPTTGGCTEYGYQSAASTNSTLIAAGARTLCSLNLVNTSATVYYVRLYNLGTAPTCSSATGYVKSIPVLPTGGIAVDMGPYGAAYGTGLGFCITASATSTANDNAAVGVFIAASYK